MPPDPSKQPQYIDLVDFSPGIYADWHSTTGPYPDGAAQVNGTWGCVAGSQGGLMPGPKKVDLNVEIPRNPISSYGTTAGAYLYEVVNGLLVTGQTNVTASGQLIAQLPTQRRACAVVLGTQAVFGSNQVSRTRLYKPYRAPLVGVSETKQLSADANNFFDLITLTSAAGISTGFPVDFFAGPIAISRCNNANPTTQAGFPTIAAAQVAWTGSGVMQKSIVAFPKNSTPSADSTEAITPSFGAAVQHILAHQGRFVFSAAIDVVVGQALLGATTLVSDTDILDFTAVNNYSGTSGLTGGVCYAPEGPGGIGCLTTMNASEMFAVRRYAGAYSIRGDVAAPNIVSLPSVVPTGIHGNNGVLTPNGFVYGSQYGVYTWGGGDTSQCISSQLTGLTTTRIDPQTNSPMAECPFWRDVNSPIYAQSFAEAVGSAAQFAFAYPYIFTPNNWLNDTRTGAWFRLSDPTATIYSWYSNAPDGSVVAAPTVIAPPLFEAFSWFDPFKPASYFTWTSQPLSRTQGRYIEAREITILAQGIGTVTVTLIGVNGAAEPVSFPINSPTPQLYSRPYSCFATDVVVNITSSATKQDSSLLVNDGLGAPRIYRLRIGYQESQTGRG